MVCGPDVLTGVILGVLAVVLPSAAAALVHRLELIARVRDTWTRLEWRVRP